MKLKLYSEFDAFLATCILEFYWMNSVQICIEMYYTKGLSFVTF